ncbi:I78 family peptidase inhibitor [Variovorax sp. W6]|uniref:I78 family peptidase inhibitor n=1 Tax=Variovorax sp. W6 TaxID=3093895 RepID=UPI003D80251A
MKLDSRLIPGVALTLATLSIAACGTPQAQDAGSAPAAVCRQDAAAALTGKNRISDADARQATGASIVRQVQPGQGVTMDYRRERVTIETDPATGKIVRAYCG